MYDNSGTKLPSETIHHSVANIHLFDGTTNLVLENFIDSNLDYFEDYNVTFGYTNNTDGDISVVKSDGDHVLERFKINGRDPFPKPILVVSNPTPDSMTLTLSNPDGVYPIAGIDDRYFANVGYKRADQTTYVPVTESNTFVKLSDFQLSGLLRPNTYYTFTLLDFKHHADTSPNGRIQISTDNLEFGTLLTETDDVYSKINGARTDGKQDHGANVVKIISEDNANVSQIHLQDYQFFTSAESQEYNLYVEIHGKFIGLVASGTQYMEVSGIPRDSPGTLVLNSTDFKIPDTITHYSLDFFESYELQFSYKNVTDPNDTAFATDSVGDLIIETLQLPAADPFTVPFTISTASMNYMNANIDVGLTYTAPSETALTNWYSFTLVARQSGETHWVELEVPADLGETIAGNTHRIGPITQTGDYYVTIRDFKHYRSLDNPSSVQWDTRNLSNVGPISFGSVTITYMNDRIIRQSLFNDNGYTHYLRFESFNFNDGGSGLEYDMLVRYKDTTLPNVTVSNIQDKTDFNVNVSSFEIPHFADANIEFRFTQNENVVQRDSQDLVIEKVAQAAANLVPPGISSDTVTANVTSVSFVLDYSFISPANITDTYHANVEYHYDPDDIKHIVRNDWSTSDNMFTINKLVPNKRYHLKLKNFQHYINGRINDNAIKFDSPNTIQTPFTTDSDEVHSNINGKSINVTHDSDLVDLTKTLGSDGRITSITLPSFVFNTLATGKHYTMSFEFTDGELIELGSSSGIYKHSNIQDHPDYDDLVLNFETKNTFYPKYFETYNVSVTYLNTTDDEGVTVIDEDDTLIEKFRISASDPIPRANIIEDTKTAERIIVKLDSTPFNGFFDILQDSYYANVGYRKHNENFMTDFTEQSGNLGNISFDTGNVLAPNTTYTFVLTDFGHYHNGAKNGNIEFETSRPEISITTDNDNVSSEVDGTPTDKGEWSVHSPNVVSTELNDQGYLSKIILKNYEFITTATNKSYTLEVTFEGNVYDNSGTKLPSETIHHSVTNIQHYSSARDLVLENFIDFNLDYFEDYNVTFGYINNTDGDISVVNDLSEHVLERFKINGGNSLNIPITAGGHTKTATTITVDPISYNADLGAIIALDATGYRYRLRAVDTQSTDQGVQSDVLTGSTTSHTFTGLSPGNTYKIEVIECSHTSNNLLRFEARKEILTNIELDMAGPSELITEDVLFDSAKMYFAPASDATGDTATVLGSDPFKVRLRYTSINATPQQHTQYMDYTLSNYANYFNNDFILLYSVLPNTTYTVTLANITHDTYTISNSQPFVRITTATDNVDYNPGSVTRTLKNDDGHVGHIKMPNKRTFGPYAYKYEWNISSSINSSPPQQYVVRRENTEFAIPLGDLNYFDNTYQYNIKIRNYSFDIDPIYYYARRLVSTGVMEDIVVTGKIKDTSDLGEVKVVVPEFTKSDNTLSLNFTSTSGHTFLPGHGGTKKHVDYDLSFTPYDLYRLRVEFTET